MVSSRMGNEAGNEKIVVMAKLTDATARIMLQLSLLNASSQRFRVLREIVERLDAVANELER